jgi:hypothetical protein
MMTRLETTQISGIIANASLDDLRMIRTMLSNRQDMLGFENKISLQVGMKVRVNHPKLAGVELSINKINRTKATVSLKSGAVYVVPLSLIESI